MSGIFDLFKKIKKEETVKGIEWIIAGLGNPGLQYEKTRHNAGFMALDTIAQEKNIAVTRVKFKAMTGIGVLEGKKCLLMKPTTYMNNSGLAITEAANFYKIPMHNVVILYDDISLEPGHMRIRRKGTHGGHNGIKDIIELTGEEVFPRVKIGVGKKPNPRYNLADWVLSSFTQQEKEQVQEICKQSVNAVELIVQGQIEEAMNRYNH